MHNKRWNKVLAVVLTAATAFTSAVPASVYASEAPDGGATTAQQVAEVNEEDVPQDVAEEVSEEQVLERNPDYIVTITMYFGEGPTPEEEIMGRNGWENVTAVKNSAILNLQNNELSRPVPRLADGAKMLCEFVYGDEEAAAETMTE